MKEVFGRDIGVYDVIVERRRLTKPLPNWIKEETNGSRVEYRTQNAERVVMRNQKSARMGALMPVICKNEAYQSKQLAEQVKEVIDLKDNYRRLWNLRIRQENEFMWAINGIKL